MTIVEGMLAEASVGAATLYHGTTFDGLLSIFTKNILQGFPTDVRIGRKIAHDGPPSVSFTRDKKVALSHAGKDQNAGKGKAILVFDRERLVRHFGRKLQPVDVLQIRGHSPDNPFTGFSEAEERVVGNVDHVLDYLTDVLIIDQPAFERFKQNALANDPNLEDAFALIGKYLA